MQNKSKNPGQQASNLFLLSQPQKTPLTLPISLQAAIYQAIKAVQKLLLTPKQSPSNIKQQKASLFQSINETKPIPAHPAQKQKTKKEQTRKGYLHAITAKLCSLSQ